MSRTIADKETFYDNDYQTFDRKKTVTGKKIPRELRQQSWDMKKKKDRTLRDCKDEEVVKISSGKNAASYTVTRKFGRSVLITSTSSGKSYWKEQKTKVF